MATQPQELRGTSRLRSNRLPRKSLILLRGGPEPVADLAEQAENSGRRYTLDGEPFFALSLAAVLQGTTVDYLLASRPLRSFARYHRMTAGQLYDAGYTVWATFARENHYDVRLPSAHPQSIRDFLVVAGPLYDNPHYQS